jgi:hypothetical protein
MASSSTFVMPTLSASWRRSLTLVSPLLVIAFGHLVARLAVPNLGAWAWVPVSFTYWALMGLFIGLSAGLRPSGTGSARLAVTGAGARFLC